MQLRLIRLIGIALLSALVVGCTGEAPPAEIRSLDVPAAAGSMGPNLATGPDGQIVLSWMEPEADGHALRYSVLGDSGWETPQTVARGDGWFVNWADFPSVVPMTGAIWAAHWLDSQPDGGYAYDIKLALSADGGKTWSLPFIPHFDETPTEHGFVTLFPDTGGIGLVWLDGRKMINDYDEQDVGASGMTLRAATFGLDQLPVRDALVDDLTCDCCQTDLAQAADGPVVAYRNRTTEEIRDIYVSRREFGEWQPGTPVADDHWEIPACPVNGPIIRAHDSQVAVAWFTAANDVPTVKAAWSADSGRTFAAPVDISVERPLGHIGAVLLPEGDLVVSWHGSIGEGDAELLLRRVSPGGAMGDVYHVPTAGDAFSFSVPQLALHRSELVVAWTVSVDKSYQIRSALVPLAILEPR